MILNLTIFLKFFIEDICPAMRVYLGKKPLIEETGALEQVLTFS